MMAWFATIATFLVRTIPSIMTHLITFLALNFIHIGRFLN